MRHLANIDQRPKLHQLRRRQLAEIAEQRGVQHVYEDGTEMTKDHLLVALEVKSYTPKTVPLGKTPDNAPYESYEWIGLKRVAKDRGIVAAPTWKKQDYIDALNAADAELVEKPFVLPEAAPEVPDDVSPEAFVAAAQEAATPVTEG